MRVRGRRADDQQGSRLFRGGGATVGSSMVHVQPDEKPNLILGRQERLAHRWSPRPRPGVPALLSRGGPGVPGTPVCMAYATACGERDGPAIRAARRPSTAPGAEGACVDPARPDRRGSEATGPGRFRNSRVGYASSRVAGGTGQPRSITDPAQCRQHGKRSRGAVTLIQVMKPTNHATHAGRANCEGEGCSNRASGSAFA